MVACEQGFLCLMFLWVRVAATPAAGKAAAGPVAGAAVFVASVEYPPRPPWSRHIVAPKVRLGN